VLAPGWDFTVAHGLLTLALKVTRRSVVAKYETARPIMKVNGTVLLTRKAL
jgi:hypothetical protein